MTDPVDSPASAVLLDCAETAKIVEALETHPVVEARSLARLLKERSSWGASEAERLFFQRSLEHLEEEGSLQDGDLENDGMHKTAFSPSASGCYVSTWKWVELPQAYPCNSDNELGPLPNQVEVLFNAIANADFVTMEEDAGPATVATAPIEGAPENQVFYLSSDSPSGAKYSVILDELSLAEATFDTSGIYLKDTEDMEVHIRIWKLAQAETSSPQG